jgi:hypothetical protein
VLISRGSLFEIDTPQRLPASAVVNGGDSHSFYSIHPKDYDSLTEDRTKLTPKLQKAMKRRGGACDDVNAIQNIVLDLADAVVDFCDDVDPNMKGNQEYDPQQVSGIMYLYRGELKDHQVDLKFR